MTARALQECFDANRAWSTRHARARPQFFERLVQAQTPELLWIGCSDSRLPPDQVVGRLPGETIVQDAWRRGQPLAVHGWIYALADGLLRDVGLVVESPDQVPPAYRIR